jgi:hypothetical protein
LYLCQVKALKACRFAALSIRNFIYLPDGIKSCISRDLPRLGLELFPLPSRVEFFREHQLEANKNQNFPGEILSIMLLTNRMEEYKKTYQSVFY